MFLFCIYNISSDVLSRVCRAFIQDKEFVLCVFFMIMLAVYISNKVNIICFLSFCFHEHLVNDIYMKCILYSKLLDSFYLETRIFHAYTLISFYAANEQLTCKNDAIFHCGCIGLLNCFLVEKEIRTQKEFAFLTHLRASKNILV